MLTWSPGGDTLGTMCIKVLCDECEKPTYEGCGQHIEQVLGDIPEADRCHCRELANSR